jgi:lipopolysaccharide/colanic/teichoic acid biosynthesis glycosyltransferase
MFKRLFDISLVLIFLFILMPVLLILSILIKVRIGSPIIFKQMRPGFHERIFTIYKFRTMTNKKDIDGNLQPDALRLTKFGAFLRAASLDELPQLFNVLKGDMSFVGPRALLLEYLPLYNANQRKRHSVKPGITGWAQVNGRNALSWDQKFEFDLWYVEHNSFLLDIRILCLTVFKVFSRQGVSAPGNVTMPKFIKGEESE